MKNIIIILTFFVFGSGLIFFTSSFEKHLSEQKNTQEVSLSGEVLALVPDQNIALEPDIVRDKIDLIKKRLADKGIIIEGDSYYRHNQLPLALKKYLEFYKKNPNDPLIIEKIAATYFEMKKFGSSLNYLQKLDPLQENQKEAFALSVLYSEDLSSPESRGKIIDLLKKNNFSPEELMYYSTSLDCMSDFHSCKLSFQSYFGSGALQDISGTGSFASGFAPLQKIYDASLNYNNFQLDDVSLKNAYLIGAWYHNKLYPLSIALGEALLKEKPGYKPILKIVAQSYYELGKYEEARNILGIYYKIDTNDSDVLYMLGVVNEKLADYVLANIYLRKALELGYTPSIVIRRQLIHNLYILENDTGMLEEFNNLVEQETTLEAEDLGLAIYYHIIHENIEQAHIWSKKGQELFPENGDFYAYEGWILREMGKHAEAFSLLQTAGAQDKKNPFLLINIAYTAQVSGNVAIASVYFKKVLQEFPHTQWGVQAEKELQVLGTEKR